MAYQCEICPDVFSNKEQGYFFDQNRVLTSPGYWQYLFTTKASFFEVSMLNSYLDMLCKDTSGFTICNKCKTMLEADATFAQELGITEYVKTLSDGKVDRNAAAIVFGSVWRKMHGTWPSTIKVNGFNTSKPPQNKKTEIPNTKSSSDNVESLKNPVKQGENKIKNSDQTEKKPSLILDSVIKKAEENSWANILQKQILEFEKKNNEQEKIIKEIERKNNEEEKLIKEFEKKIENFEKLMKNMTTTSKSKLLRFTPTLSLILFILLVISTIYLNNKRSSQPRNDSTEISIENGSQTENAFAPSNSETHKNSEDIKQNINTVNPENKEQKKPTTATETKPKETIESNLVTVPSVKGLFASIAEGRLRDVSLNATIINVSFGEENIGKVVKQKPEAGSKVKKNSSVIIQVGE